MNRPIITLISGLVGLSSLSASAAVTSEVSKAIYSRNIPLILKEADKSKENEVLVVDAFCSEIDLNDYSYEELKFWKNSVNSLVISELLSDALIQKENEILNEVRGLTAEQFSKYVEMFPHRSELLTDFITTALINNLKDLSVEELVYVDDNLPYAYHDTISAEIGSRSAEIAGILDNNLSRYKQYERALAERMKYMVEEIVWTYFVEGHKALNSAYSEIGIVPDNAYTAAEQYQRLVTACFPVKQIQNRLQNEINRFGEQINSARQDYFIAAGKKSYPKFSYTVPVMNLNSKASIESLMGIAEAREQFVQSRQNVSTGTSVLGFLFGPAVGLISKGIGDWFVIEDLVSSEFSSRKQYMEDVQKKLLTSFANYSNSITSNIDNSLK